MQSNRKPRPTDLLTSSLAAAEAKRLGLAKMTRYRVWFLARTGRLPFVPVGTNQIAIRRDVLEEYVRTQLSGSSTSAAA